MSDTNVAFSIYLTFKFSRYSSATPIAITMTLWTLVLRSYNFVHDRILRVSLIFMNHEKMDAHWLIVFIQLNVKIGLSCLTRKELQSLFPNLATLIWNNWFQNYAFHHVWHNIFLAKCKLYPVRSVFDPVLYDQIRSDPLGSGQIRLDLVVVSTNDSGHSEQFLI